METSNSVLGQDVPDTSLHIRLLTVPRYVDPICMPAWPGSMFHNPWRWATSKKVWGANTISTSSSVSSVLCKLRIIRVTVSQAGNREPLRLMYIFTSRHKRGTVS